jgi:hypothetical protein
MNSKYPKYKLDRGSRIDAHMGEGVRSEKLSHKNAIKREKRGPLDFLTTHSTPLKIILPKP